MDYLAAFNSLVDQHGLTVLEDSFLVRSFLSDYVSSYLECQLIDAFYKLNDVYPYVRSHTLEESKDYIKKQIKDAGPSYTITQYIRSVEPLLLKVFPSYTRYQPKPVNKPVSVKRNNKPVVVDNNNYHSLHMDVRCKNLTLTYGSSRKIRILNNKNKDITDTVSYYYDNGKLSFDFKKKRGDFLIELPKRDYQYLSIVFKGNKLTIKGDDVNKFTVRDSELNIVDGDVDMDIIGKTLNVKQGHGFFSYNGSLTGFNYNGLSGGVYASFIDNDLKKCNVKLDYGNIMLFFLACKIRPRINHLIRKVRSVDGVYFLKKNLVKLVLSAPKGNIKVY